LIDLSATGDRPGGLPGALLVSVKALATNRGFSRH
jgi:hypothetical protein